MRAARVAFALVLAAGCGGPGSAPEIEGTRVTVAGASLEVPAGWQPTVNASTDRQVWVPVDNRRKESIAVRVVPRKGTTTIDDLLDRAALAEAALADAHVTGQHRVTTNDGVPGIWIDLTFTPGHVAATYTRSQLTLVTETHIIHVLYTARDPDDAHRALDLALHTIREEA